MARHKSKIIKYQARTFGASKSNQPRHMGKLRLKWEGPFLVVSSSRPGSYRMRDMDVNDIPRSWNADELQRYYVEIMYFPFFPLWHPFPFKRGERFLMGP
jgi:hypothetical protein